MIEVSDAAKAELLRINRDRQPGTAWRVRIEFTPEGCTGMKTNLRIDTDPPRPQDTTCQCGAVGCIYSGDQFPLVQGTLIDWVQNEKESGFKVTFPHKTKENRDKTTKWIMDEFEKWKERNTPKSPG